MTPKGGEIEETSILSTRLGKSVSTIWFSTVPLSLKRAGYARDRPRPLGAVTVAVKEAGRWSTAGPSFRPSQIVGGWLSRSDGSCDPALSLLALSKGAN